MSRGYYLEPIKTPIPLFNFNGEGEESTIITYFLVADLRIYNYLEKEAFLFATNLFYYLIILGIPWLKLHDPELKFKKGIIIFSSNVTAAMPQPKYKNYNKGNKDQWEGSVSSDYTYYNNLLDYNYRSDAKHNINI